MISEFIFSDIGALVLWLPLFIIIVYWLLKVFKEQEEMFHGEMTQSNTETHK